jgi:nicotinamide-nucleotide amidase
MAVRFPAFGGALPASTSLIAHWEHSEQATGSRRRTGSGTRNLNDTETLSPVLPNEVEEATRRLLAKASERGLVVATAESCTGGMLASLLTDVQGVAHAFDRGFVTYSEEAKTEMLGVPAALIEDKGAVSKEVAVAMAEGALSRSRANIALAITGFADTGEEPGLVHFACARNGRITAHREEHFGGIGRGAVRVKALDVAIAMMTEML